MILAVYRAQPSFPATDQNPAALRAQVGVLWVDYTVTLPTQAQVTAFLDLGQTRTIQAIVADINALSAAKKTAVWSDLTSGTPPKWKNDIGPRQASLAAIAQTIKLVGPLAGVVATDLTDAKVWAVAIYVQDNPSYLVNPAFDATINIPGKA